MGATGGAGADGRHTGGAGVRCGASTGGTRTGEPARGADILHHQRKDLAPPGAPRDWVRDSSVMPDPMGGKALPLVMEVYGWLSWATSGTTRGMRNWPSEAVLLRNVGGNPEVPPGGCVDREDDESRDSGGMARPWAGVARLPGRGGGALAAPAPAHRTRPLTLPPEECATTPASAPAQTEAPGRNAGREPRSPDGVWGGLTSGLERPPRHARAPQQ